MVVLRLALVLTVLLALPVVAEQATVRLQGVNARLPAAPPFAWYDECEGRSKGASHVLMQRVFKDLGYQITWVPLEDRPFTAFSEYLEVQLARLMREELDMIAVPEKMRTDSRLHVSPVRSLEFQLVLLSHRDRRLESLDSLKELQGALGRQAYGVMKAKGLAFGTRLRGVHDIGEAMERLALREIDYMIVVKHSATMLMQAKQIGDSLYMHPLPGKMGLCPVIKAGSANERWFPAFVEQLRSYKETGLADQIMLAGARQWIRTSHCAARREYGAR